MATLKLKEITTQYRSFVDDQVLTASQLNTIIDYFEDQNRLTRICLNGVGIVCGLQITYQENESITVSSGCGVTTDGDLINFEEKVFTHSKPFEDKNAAYQKFEGISGILELTNANPENNQVVELSTLEDIQEKVVVLYLENYSKEETPCTSEDCDTQGEEQIAKVRVLLLSKSDAAILANQTNDPIFSKHRTTKKFINLPEISVKRVVIKNNYIVGKNNTTTISENSNTASYNQLKTTYFKAIKENDTLPDLKNAITRLYTDFRTLLDTDSLDVKRASTIVNRITGLFNFSKTDIPLDIQYRYDLLKDLVSTYNEIKKLLFDLRVACCPNTDSFPKHLLLGELVPIHEYAEYRHTFYPSPIITNGLESWNEIRNLIHRMYYMLSEYTIPSSPFTEIEVTPSHDYDKDLSRRSIPYYYKTSKNLVKNWNYTKTKKYEEDQNLGYHKENLSLREAIKNPLDYNIDHNDFFRIEGHLGKDYRAAFEVIDTIKNEKGLPFDVKVLSIDETLETLDISDYKCHFEDLAVVLKAWKAEQDCLNASVSKFFSGFSVKNKGEHKYYKVNQFAVIEQGLVEDKALLSEKELLKPVKKSKRQKMAIDMAMLKSMVSIGGFQPIYYQNRVVAENLNVDDDVLGKIVYNAFEEKPMGSAEDIIAAANDVIAKDPEISKWEDEIKEMVIAQPLEILAHAKVAEQRIPNAIEELTTDRVTAYKNTIDRLCKKIEAYKKNTTGLLYANGSNYERSGFEQQYALLLNQLSVNCCAAEKIEILLAEIEKRKEEVLSQKLLSKFVEKHSGLEHKAGVRPGGTFVMVYRGKHKSKAKKPAAVEHQTMLNPEMIADQLQALGVENFFENRRTHTRSKDSKSKMKLEKLEQGLKRGSTDFFMMNNKIMLEAKNRSRDFDIFKLLEPNISENTVIADFSLPYLCSSNCSPTAFIIPKQPVSLRLPDDHVCLNEATKPIAFEAIPANGVVTADVEDNLEAGVVKQEGKYFFDASKISEELLGKEIRFKLNDQYTEAKIIVFKKPDFDFSHSDPQYFKDNTIAQVNFTVQGANLSNGVKYLWDFGDGTLPNNVEEENPRHVYQLPVNENNKVEVTLKVTNGKCSTTVPHEIQFETQTLSRCVAQGKEKIEKDHDELPKYNDMSSNLVEKVYTPTDTQYIEVKAKIEDFINGKLNNELIDRFNELINGTVQGILNHKEEDSFEYFALTSIFRLQVQLLYNILRCQKNEQIKGFEEIINQLLKMITDAIDQCIKNKKEIDKEGLLKSFLEEFKQDVEDVDVLVNNVKNQIELL